MGFAKTPLAPVQVANELRPVLLRLARSLRSESHALGLTARQVTLLAAINDQPGIGVLELARREEVSAASISQNLRGLERAGLIARETGEDRRRVGLGVTKQGVKVIQSVRSRRTAWLASRLAQLDAEEIAAVEAAIGPLTKMLGRAE
jgi:DNA-binding MarR family transcriptional regulator